MASSTSSERLRRIRAELEKAIDVDLERKRSTPEEVDFHVLDRYSAYLGYRTVEAYRKAALYLSIAAVVAAVIGVVNAILH